MQEPEIILVITTLDSIREAKNLSRILINEKLCACVQIEQVKSLFEWEGKFIRRNRIINRNSSTINLIQVQMKLLILTQFTLDLLSIKKQKIC